VVECKTFQGPTQAGGGEAYPAAHLYWECFCGYKEMSNCLFERFLNK
jgi:hypothetical protein